MQLQEHPSVRECSPIWEDVSVVFLRTCHLLKTYRAMQRAGEFLQKRTSIIPLLVLLLCAQQGYTSASSSKGPQRTAGDITNSQQCAQATGIDKTRALTVSRALARQIQSCIALPQQPGQLHKDNQPQLVTEWHLEGRHLWTLYKT